MTDPDQMEVGVRWDDSGGDGGQVTGSLAAQKSRRLLGFPLFGKPRARKCWPLWAGQKGVRVQDMQVIEAAGH